MEILYKMGYLVLIGFLIFCLFRRGGCCGHRNHHHRHDGEDGTGRS